MTLSRQGIAQKPIHIIATKARDLHTEQKMDVNGIELSDEVLSSREIMAEPNGLPKSGPPHRPIAIELDLCLYRAVTEYCGGRVVLPFGVRRLIKDYAFVSFDEQTLRKAVQLWCGDRAQARQLYGEINDWDVSKITDMASLFYEKTSFNDRIDRWDVHNVTSMDDMFNQPLSP